MSERSSVVDVNSVLDTEVNGSLIMTTSEKSFVSDHHNNDTTESTNFGDDDIETTPSPSVNFNSGEASFPSPEELRVSSTSRKNSRNIWPGASKNGSPNGGSPVAAKKSNRRCLWIAFIGFVFLVLIVIVPSIVVRNNKKEVSNSSEVDNGDDDDEPASRPRPYYNEIVDFIVSNRISSESDVDNSSSPQSRAIFWLMQDDPANVVVPTSSGLDTYKGYKYMVRYVMAVTFFALDGPSWEFDLKFLSEEDVCDWNDTIFIEGKVYTNGIACKTRLSDDGTSLERYPSALHLVIQIGGTIPLEIGKLDTIESLQLAGSDNLVGSIPTELCTMSSLRGLFLNLNLLTGEIPTCVNELQKLEVLELSRNELVGNIPSQLCLLPALRDIYSVFNQHNGTIQSCLGFMPSLEELVLFANEFTESIPVELCDAKKLKYINLGRNLMVGEIPECLGEMEFLEAIDLSENNFFGTIPETFLELNDTLKLLNLDFNDLNGDPSNIFNQLGSIAVLIGSNNEFNFTIDSSFLADSKLIANLDLSHNNLNGSFPTYLLNISNYPSLFIIDLSENQLTGQFTDIPRNTQLQYLGAYGNMMNGTLSELANLTGLIHLDLSNNQFTGSMEPIGTLPFMTNLFLSENPFDAGPIPDSFRAFDRIEELSLRNTNLNGALVEPIDFSWIKLEMLDLGSNNLEGTIPAAYGTLFKLAYLLLNDNNGINGTVPTEFERMTQLQGVLLDGTSVTEALDIFCELPNFSNVTGYELLIVDCDGDCTQCEGCRCCNPDNDAGCSKPNLGNIDGVWINGWRRQFNTFNFSSLEVSSTTV